jgi:mRNA-degrading endonuclease YafQ of YafQ-DinJ toxin-antitoxin module
MFISQKIKKNFLRCCAHEYIPVLRDHTLTGDIRVIYYIHKGSVYFADIGTHNQVY